MFVTLSLFCCSLFSLPRSSGVRVGTGRRMRCCSRGDGHVPRAQVYPGGGLQSGGSLGRWQRRECTASRRSGTLPFLSSVCDGVVVVDVVVVAADAALSIARDCPRACCHGRDLVCCAVLRSSCSCPFVSRLVVGRFRAFRTIPQGATSSSVRSTMDSVYGAPPSSVWRTRCTIDQVCHWKITDARSEQSGRKEQWKPDVRP